jgi:FkbM family methyltransferase
MIKKKIFVLLSTFHNSRLCRFFKSKLISFLDALNNINNDHLTNGERWLQSKVVEAGFTSVFDVGANTGDWAKNMIALKNNIYIYLFEPIPDLFLKLQEFNFENIKVYSLALADELGEASFSINLDNSIFSSFYKRQDFKNSKVLIVQKITGDKFCIIHKIEKIDFLKIDVEGYEYAVLKGFYKMLQEEKIGVIQFEYGVMNIHSRTFLKDFFDYLVPFGFKIGKLYPKSIEFIDYSYSLEDFRWANYVAVHKSKLPNFL